VMEKTPGFHGLEPRVWKADRPGSYPAVTRSR